MRLALLALLALTLTAAAAAAPPRAKVATRATTLGTVLVDAHGRTLYGCALVTRGRSACSGSCAALWSPLLTTGTPVALAGVPATRLGTARRADGRLQATFMGRPLYTFAKDRKAGQVAGASMPQWAALTATGKRLHASAASSPSPTPTPSPSPSPQPPYGGGDGY
jgi:predicted lipoprotein with Yx(FWY)xxD motif